MASLKVWTSGVGIIAMLMYVAGAVGGFFSGFFFWLPLYQAYAETIFLILMIAMFAVAGFCLIALVISLFGLPKALWIIFAFLSLACVVTVALLMFLLTDLATALGISGFVYFDLGWYNLSPEAMWDFIGFWLAAGGSFLALVFGFFIPKKI
ncbi:MAG: hypothetical protein H7645_03750 [Candidatus Heimdallarchaeota archaeon]|nr:hypothetical protein [Candidatus Heimdallarchaeota archaeon]MCK4769430.1 hypothetical protein [Candidatus Heimdallarchaeota archaeon]